MQILVHPPQKFCLRRSKWDPDGKQNRTFEEGTLVGLGRWPIAHILGQMFQNMLLKLPCDGDS